MTGLGGIIRLLTVAVLLTALAPTRIWAQGTESDRPTDQISLLAPSFVSETPALGRNVSTVLGLQVWRTLRQAPTPNPKELHFGDGAVYWSPDTPPPLSHAEAESRARRIAVLAQMVFWGETFRYADAVIVEPHLSLPRYRDFRVRRNELWTLKFGRDTRLTCDVPRRRYSFEPIILRPDIVDRYTSPVGLSVYADTDFTQEIGTLDARFTAIEVHGDKALVVTRNDGRSIRGWVPLEPLSESRSEVTDFVAGVLRIYRADWEGAMAMFARVLENENAPTDIRVDAALYRARAAAALGLDPRTDAAVAAKLGARSRQVAIYTTMADLAALRQGRRDTNPAETLASLHQAGPYFEPNDAWFEQAVTVLNMVRRRPPVVGEER